MQHRHIIICYAVAVSFLWWCSKFSGSWPLNLLYLFHLRLYNEISRFWRLLRAFRHLDSCLPLRMPLFGRVLHRLPPTHYRKTFRRTYLIIPRLRIAGRPSPCRYFGPELVEVVLQKMRSILLWSIGWHLNRTRHLLHCHTSQ